MLKKKIFLSFEKIRTFCLRGQKHRFNIIRLVVLILFNLLSFVSLLVIYIFKIHSEGLKYKFYLKTNGILIILIISVLIFLFIFYIFYSKYKYGKINKLFIFYFFLILMVFGNVFFLISLISTDNFFIINFFKSDLKSIFLNDNIVYENRFFIVKKEVWTFEELKVCLPLIESKLNYFFPFQLTEARLELIKNNCKTPKQLELLIHAFEKERIGKFTDLFDLLNHHINLEEWIIVVVPCYFLFSIFLGLWLF